MALKQSNSNHANAVEENKKATKPEPKTRRPRTEKAKPAQEKAGRAKVQEKPARAKAADHPARSSRATHTSRTEKAPVRRTPVRIIPLGGLNEIGKNITCFECGQDMFIVDCGLAFPDTDMLGVDIVIPDYSYIEKNADRIRGLFITHGHEDHIGGIPYLLKKVNIPIYGSRLTLGLIEGKLREHGLLSSANLNVVVPRQTIKVGCMAVEMLRVNHSIPDAMGLAIHTPAGVIIHTGDFKVDYTPIEGEVIDLARFAELGNKGVLCLMSDSTNAERPGYTPSERTVGESFERLFKAAGSRRIIIATFSSNIHRVQQIVDNAVNHGRKVAISGRSMINVVSKAIELGYLQIPEGVLIDIDDITRYPNERLTIITTGSQGEPLSALSRMASGDHGKVSVTADDYIIISATPIPGNEKHVTRVVNDLMRLGAKVIYEKMYDVHVSGHACQDELKMILSITKPRYFLPVHGEYKHRKRHAELAMEMGIEPSRIHLGDIGQVVEIDNIDMRVTGTAQAGMVFVDGLGVGDVGSIVLRDRKILSQDGLIIVVMTIENESGCIVAGPDIVSRGFVYVRESEQLMDEAHTVVEKALEECSRRNTREWGTIKSVVKDALSSFIYRKTKRSPMILPIIMEI
ncbi:MAG TPA: ribonuclease J [Firmicutes bacterium]|nr:ribonuclease J [Bacillota bacterium]